MTWQFLRAGIPVLAIAFGVITQPHLRMFVGSVLAAVGAIGLFVAAVDHSAEAMPIAVAAVVAVGVGVALVWWSYDRSPGRSSRHVPPTR